MILYMRKPRRMTRLGMHRNEDSSVAHNDHRADHPSISGTCMNLLPIDLILRNHLRSHGGIENTV